MSAPKGGALFAFAAALAATTAFAQPATPPSASPAVTAAATLDSSHALDILRGAMNAPRTVSYVGQVEMIRWGPTGTNAALARVEHLAPDRTHRTFVAPESIYGDAVIVNGAQTWSYDTRHQRVVLSKSPIFDLDTLANDNFGLLAANYRLVADAEDTVAGQKTVPISLVNRFTGERLMKIWVDRQTRLILEKESYHSGGAIASRLMFDRIRYTSDIPASLFVASVPKGFAQASSGHDPGTPSNDLDRVLKSAGFPTAGPRYLPEGFTIVSADLATLRGVRTLHVLYSDGIRSLSLFENASNAAADFGKLQPQRTKVEDHDAEYVNDGPTTLLAWKEQGLALALVGDLALAELEKIAASVIP